MKTVELKVYLIAKSMTESGAIAEWCGSDALDEGPREARRGADSRGGPAEVSARRGRGYGEGRCWMSAKCADCKFFFLSECRRHPPILQVDMGVTGVFPNVRDDQWCGEFKRKTVLAELLTKEQMEQAKDLSEFDDR